MMNASSHERQSHKVFAHDWRDGLLVALSVFEFGSRSALCLNWSALPMPVTILCLAGLCLLNGMNYICAAHDFLHLPFFTRTWANRVWGIVGSLSLTTPISLYRAHHLNHHRFNMDHFDARIDGTRDWSSIYRHGPAPDKPEAFLRYSLLGPLRQSPLRLIAEARRQGDWGQLVTETAFIAMAAVVLMILDWRGFLLIYLPVYYFGQVIAMAEAYSEHFGATPGDRRRDAVSCYNRLYNFLCFNAGYHQEHHFRPQVHWTRAPGLRSQMLSESERKVVRGAHLTNALDANWVRPAPQAPS